MLGHSLLFPVVNIRFVSNGCGNTDTSVSGLMFSRRPVNSGFLCRREVHSAPLKFVLY